LFALPSARPPDTINSPSAFRVHSFLGLSGFSAVFDAARRLPPLRGGRRRGSSVGRRQAHVDQAYMLFLARWARRLSWKETAEAFRTSWEKVFDAVEHVVTFGLEHRKLGQIDAIGVDEIQYAKGHKYLTLVYQIDLGVTRCSGSAKKERSNPFRDSSPPSATRWLRRSSSSVPTCGSPI
jgi:hypothetical protein